MHSFSQVPQVRIPRSRFDMSKEDSTTFNAGYVVPFLAEEVLPGDTFDLSTSCLIRMATPLHPIMSNLYVDYQFFFVPNRLVWTNWERFQGARDNPTDSIDYLTPIITSPAGGWDVHSLFNKVKAIPIGVPGLDVLAFPFRAYNLIWNEWYRDENIQSSIPVLKGDGPDPHTNYVLRKRGKRKDYFTSCLPWPQKGPAVSLPLGVSAPVYGDGKVLGLTDGSAPFAGLGGNATGALNPYTGSYGTNVGTGVSGGPLSGSLGYGVVTSGSSGLIADLSSATSATINQLREAFTIQQMYERDARGGTRYPEILKSHFGVTSPDARLQRPEYLGGKSVPFLVKPLAQLSSSTASSPQGNLAAMAFAQDTGAGFVKSFVEHGWILGLISVRTELVYQQGLHRSLSRRKRLEYYMPVFAHLGEQAVLNKEIYAVGSVNLVQDNAVFGYQERWAEYRYSPSTVSGEFSSLYAQSLDTWHLAQDFANLPTLNTTFIEENPPIERVVATPEQDNFLANFFTKMYVTRAMPMYSVPAGLGQF